MAKKTDSRAKVTKIDREPSKEQLQRQMARTRESLAETVGEIKETVEQQVDLVKKGVSGVLNYREEFQKDPLLLSLGALSAGFALGYTVGYSHKNAKGGKRNQVTAFADTMVEQLSGMGQGFVLPALDAKISELFGFDFSALLQKVSETTNAPAKKKTARRPAPKALPKGRTAKTATSASTKKRAKG